MVYVLFILGNASALILMYYYFMHYFNRAESARLKEITMVVRRMGEGDISQSAAEKTDRFNELACSINDMSTNIQEILILLWKQNTQAIDLLSRVSETFREPEDGGQEQHMEIIRQCDDVLRSHEDSRKLFREFQFFGVDLNAGGVRHHEQQTELSIRSKS